MSYTSSGQPGYFELEEAVERAGLCPRDIESRLGSFLHEAAMEAKCDSDAMLDRFLDAALFVKARRKKAAAENARAAKQLQHKEQTRVSQRHRT